MHLQLRRNASIIHWKVEALEKHTSRINNPRAKRTAKETDRAEISSGKNTYDLASNVQNRK